MDNRRKVLYVGTCPDTVDYMIFFGGDESVTLKKVKDTVDISLAMVKAWEEPKKLKPCKVSTQNKYRQLYHGRRR